MAELIDANEVARMTGAAARTIAEHWPGRRGYPQPIRTPRKKWVREHVQEWLDRKIADAHNLLTNR